MDRLGDRPGFGRVLHLVPALIAAETHILEGRIAP